eukprot:10310994-Alexandrium_andersonii.AAC.1
MLKRARHSLFRPSWRGGRVLHAARVPDLHLLHRSVHGVHAGGHSCDQVAEPQPASFVVLRLQQLPLRGAVAHG